MDNLNAPTAVRSVPGDSANGQFIRRVADRLNAASRIEPDHGPGGISAKGVALDDLSNAIGVPIAGSHVDFNHAIELSREVQVVLLVGNPVREGHREILFHRIAEGVGCRRGRSRKQVAILYQS